MPTSLQGNFMSRELPKHLNSYSTKGYWDARYDQKGSTVRNDATEYYDWFQGSYQDFLELVLGIVSPFDLILNIGCGDSKLSSDLLAKVLNIFLFNVDYAESLINHMHQYTLKQDLQCWLPMDIRFLNLCNDSMDLVIDKGTMDALFSDGSSPWTPSVSVLDNVGMTVTGIWRVLRKGGTWICMSFGQPHFRKQYFETVNWTEKKVIPSNIYHVYLYTK